MIYRVMLYLVVGPVAGMSITLLHLPLREACIVSVLAGAALTVVAYLLPNR